MSAWMSVPDLKCPKCNATHVQVGIFATFEQRGGGSWNIPTGEFDPESDGRCHKCGHEGTADDFKVEDAE